ncbi:hypothetical protein J4408_01770, partial [Candidatus Pacearchaeota archaeon]|nr:hypothetical protein [Candidatus Pacearchaeota archaeon]
MAETWNYEKYLVWGRQIGELNPFRNLPLEKLDEVSLICRYYDKFFENGRLKYDEKDEVGRIKTELKKRDINALKKAYEHFGLIRQIAHSHMDNRIARRFETILDHFQKNYLDDERILQKTG